MNLDIPLTKVTLPSGVTYGYVHYRPTASKPTILFLHGLPSAAYDWRHQISYFSKAGYGVLAPDLLGYGSTDKPVDPHEYGMRKMASEIVGILDHEHIEKVHGVGHDLGSTLLSRLANYHSERFYSYTFLDVAYAAPGIFDIDKALAASVAQVGFERFGFWKFLIGDDSVDIIRHHFDSFYSLFYPADPALWREDFGPTGAMRKWLEANRIAPLASYVTEHDKEIHRRSHDQDYTGPTNWLRAYVVNLNREYENGGDPKLRLDLPVLLVTAKRDIVAPPTMMEARVRPYADNLRVIELDTGHWLQLERPDEVNSCLEEFISELEPSLAEG